MYRFLKPLLKPAIAAAFILGTSFAPALAAGQRILVQSTTSTQNSGLYAYLLPKFTAETGERVDVVAVGTGQAIKNATNGDADVLLVHSKPAELKFVALGQGVKRYDLMYNDFIFIGPANDPDGLAKATSINDVMRRLATGKVPFISRGDNSGTNMEEVRLWKAAGISPTDKDKWYRESGSGMGATLRMATEMKAYTLSDRATWISFNHKMDAKIVYQHNPALFNQYGIIMVNPKVHPAVNVKGAKIFIKWMLSKHGQALIAAYKLDGQQLFVPNGSPYP